MRDRRRSLLRSEASPSSRRVRQGCASRRVASCSTPYTRTIIGVSTVSVVLRVLDSPRRGKGSQCRARVRTVFFQETSLATRAGGSERLVGCALFSSNARPATNLSDPQRQGPVVVQGAWAAGRKIRRFPLFGGSPGTKELDAWLTKPQRVIPSRRHGLSATEAGNRRAVIIAYLEGIGLKLVHSMIRVLDEGTLYSYARAFGLTNRRPARDSLISP